MRTKVLLSILVLFALLASCNMPAPQTPITQPPENKPVSLDENAMATAVELTAIARVTQLAGSAVPAIPTFTATPTLTSAPVVAGPCSPTVTATVNANVRSGPGTDYDIVGSLMLGQTATIVGRNDAYTWWYIDYPGVAGNHAWVAGSVVTAACVPSVVQVVAAPPTSTPTIVVADDSSGDSNDNNLQPLQPLQPLQILRPDLTVVNLDVPTTAIVNTSQTLSVTVKNKGEFEASNFTVQLWAGVQLACHWPVASLAVGASKTLNCSYKFPNTGTYTVKAVVDSGATVNESNESNNTAQKSVKVTLKFLIPQKTLIPLQP